jgi:peptidoglycan hydrolase CwlO-like protein
MIKVLIGSLLLVCLFLTNSVLAITDKEKLRQELEEQMRQLQGQISQYEEQIQKNREKARSLENEINLLENQISKIELEIKQTKLAIQKTDLNINQLQKEINAVQSDIDHQKTLLGEYIRLIDQYGQESLLEIVLKKEKFSDFFEEIHALESAQAEIYNVLEKIRGLKSELENQKEKLEDQREEQYQLKGLQEIQKNTVRKKQRRKGYILQKTKGQEELYQQKIQSTQKDIEFIKKQISLLEKYHLTLEEAITNAVAASAKTGIRPAFLLGVLEIESRLGINVGTGNWQKDMYQCYRSLGYLSKAEREKNAFFQICQELGLNPDAQPVSAEPYYGCGGAMGPAQFMPTTWLAYKDSVASLTGHNPPNPWDTLDSFTAAAVKLSRDGANQRTYEAEHRAARIYFAGSRYESKTAHRYGNMVMSQAQEFQKELFD